MCHGRPISPGAASAGNTVTYRHTDTPLQSTDPSFVPIFRAQKMNLPPPTVCQNYAGYHKDAFCDIFVTLEVGLELNKPSKVPVAMIEERV